MANNREISQFAGLVTVNDSTNNVSLGNTFLLTGNARLGIGTTNPGAKLDVAGSAQFGSNAVDTTSIQKTFSPSHVAANREAKIRIGLNDGSFAGVEVQNTVGSNGSFNSQNVHLINHNGGVAGDIYSLTARFDGSIGIGSTNPSGVARLQVSASAAQAPVIFSIAGIETARIDSGGRLNIGASSFVNSPKLGVRGNNSLSGGSASVSSTDCGIVLSSTAGGTVDNAPGIWFDHGDLFSGISGSRVSIGNWGTDLRFYTHPDSTTSQFTLPERMRITSDGSIIYGKTTKNRNTLGGFFDNGIGSNYFYLSITSGGSRVLDINRQTDDGNLVEFYQADTLEGSISVSGTTVQLNGAHLSRWSQLLNGGREEILRGTVLSNLDEMCEWGDEDNEQLNRMKVSDVESDPNVAGVFVDWDNDDDTYTDDFYCAMTGDFIIRIAEGVTVERGDLLMSAGDGTAKPQDDDIIRSKTIAKVTSTNVSCTYEDGSYCVPCVLMAC